MSAWRLWPCGSIGAYVPSLGRNFRNLTDGRAHFLGALEFRLVAVCSMLAPMEGVLALICSAAAETVEERLVVSCAPADTIPATPDIWVDDAASETAFFTHLSNYNPVNARQTR